MSQIETFSGNRYEIVAWARDQRPLYYVEFGGYQGEWLLLARDDERSVYHVYKDYYGSCSGCDAYEAELGGGDVTREKAEEFAKDFPAFIEIPAGTMRRLVEAGTLAQVFPANVRGEDGDVDYDQAVTDMTVIGKLEEGVPVTSQDVLAVRNQEVKQRALRAFGYERFVAEAGAETIHRDGEDELVRVGDVVMLHVKDSSTDRRYLLRVPPDMERVRQAKAWTFNLREDEYAPLVET